MTTIAAGLVPLTAQSPVQQAPAPGHPGPDPGGPWPGPAPTPGPGRPPLTPPPPVPPKGFPGHPGAPGGTWPPSGPPGPPTLPPGGPGWPSPGSGMPPTPPVTPPVEPLPTDPVDPPPPPGQPDEGFNWKPWLIGAGVAVAGVGAALAVRDGARNVRALQATAAAFDSGAMHQGGLHAIRDAKLGATFTKGIGTSEYLKVAVPGVNRIGEGGRLVQVARGHLDQAELLAAATALRRGVGDAVAVHEPLRRRVLEGLESGRALPSILGELDRSGSGARPVFTNPRLADYWNEASILENGVRRGSHHVTAAVSSTRPELALRPVADQVEGAGRVVREIVETGREVQVDRLAAGRGSRLGGAGLASGIGSIQAANVATLPPALRQRALAASKLDPALVEAVGLRGAYVQRWQDRIALGANAAAL